MRERPILFSGPMVRAILDGRKTQTRRVITKINPAYLDAHCGERAGVNERRVNRAALASMDCPFGVVGDRLWVREAWCEVRSGLRYRADFPEGEPNPLRFKPSIHMPRSASRLTLEVESVRVERVQDIGEVDATFEGVAPVENPAPTDPDGWDATDYRAGFARLWDSLNKSRGYGWDANPWVWAISFKIAGPLASSEDQERGE